MTGTINNGSYSTNFSATENPISEGGVWINGEATGIDWGNVGTIPGLAYGTSLKTQFADPTAVLAGTWASDQEAQGTVEINGFVSGGPHEVELRLNTTITAHSITGYEILFSVNPIDPYIQIVRWNGALNDFTYLNVVSNGVSMGVADGDVVKATHIGNTITVYKNGTQVLQATDSTYSTGSPGIGFYDSVDSNWTGFGFSRFSATNVGDTTPPGASISSTVVQNDYLGIVRVALPLDQAAAVANAINAGAQTEGQYVNSLLAQVANTAIPAVAVEASMYGAVGTSAEITLLATQYLPQQVASAMSLELDPVVVATEALGVVFATANETGSTAFATAFGPTNAAMPSSVAGDKVFAATAASAIFGSASTPAQATFVEEHVAFWKTFFTANGLHGNPDQVDLVARGTAWGELVGVALQNPNLSPLHPQAVNFLKDAAQGTAVYAASLSGPTQPVASPFQDFMPPATNVNPVGIAAQMDMIFV